MKHFKQILTDCANQDWHSSINDLSRCDFYKQFKSLLILEQYLLIDLRFDLKKSLAKFRCSSHKFKIETGRHRNIPRQDRFCEFCFQHNGLRVTEDELHVFFNCPKFESCRSNMLLTHSHTITHFDAPGKQAF